MQLQASLMFSLSSHKHPSLPEPHPTSSSQSARNAQNAHSHKCTNHAQPTAMRQIQTLAKQLQSNAGHDACCSGKHASVHALTRGPITTSGDVEPECRDTGSDRL